MAKEPEIHLLTGGSMALQPWPLLGLGHIRINTNIRPSRKNSTKCNMCVCVPVCVSVFSFHFSSLFFFFFKALYVSFFFSFELSCLCKLLLYVDNLLFWHWPKTCILPPLQPPKSLWTPISGGSCTCVDRQMSARVSCRLVIAWMEASRRRRRDKTRRGWPWWGFIHQVYKLDVLEVQKFGPQCTKEGSLWLYLVTSYHEIHTWLELLLK